MSAHNHYADWKQWSADTFGTVSASEAAYFNAEMSRLPLQTETGLKVLEIGFGNGGFAAWAKQQGWDYSGSEQIPELVKRAQSMGIRAFGDEPAAMFAALGQEQLDLIVGFDVFEHMSLSELEAMLEHMRKALRSGGCILGRVPSGDSPFGRAIYHGDITHQLALGSSAVRQLAGKHGLDVAYIKPPQLPLRGVGLLSALRRAFILAAQKLIAKAINVIFHNNSPAVITSNLVFCLRKS